MDSFHNEFFDNITNMPSSNPLDALTRSYLRNLNGLLFPLPLIVPA